MSTTSYCVAVGTTVNGTVQARATALGCSGTCLGDPSGGLIGAFPAVAVLSNATANQVLSDVGGVATLAAVQAAQATANTAESAASTNAATIKANCVAHPAGNITYLAVAVPSVAQTTAQINALTKAVNALIYQVNQLYSTTNGT